MFRLMTVCFILYIRFAVAALDEKNEEEKIRFEQFQQAFRLKNKSESPKQREGSIVRWREIIEKLLEIRCFKETMIILLHYKTSYSRLATHLANDMKLVQLSAVAANSSPCTATVNENFGYLNLTYSYTDCGTTVTNFDTSTKLAKFRNVITVLFNNETISDHLRNVHETYDVECVHDLDINTVIDTQKLLIFDQRQSKEPLKLPRKINKGTTLYIQGDAQFLEKTNLSLEVFPVNCWIAQFPADDGDKRYFLEEGCPVSDRRGRGLSTIYHYKKLSSKIGFIFDNPLINHQGNNMFLVHCEVLSCVKSFTIGVLGLSKCPNSHYCAGPPMVNHKLPDNLRNVSRTETIAGPIYSNYPNETKGSIERPKFIQEIVSTEIKCSSKCLPYTQNSTLSYPYQATTNHVEKHSTIQTKITVAIGLVSFLLGLSTMGVTWALHTNISKYRLRNRAERKYENQTDFTTSSQTNDIVEYNFPSNCIMNTIL